MIQCTVAIPSYNRKELIQKTLESVLVQKLQGLEILVVDDCSTDGVWELLQTYNDPRLRLVRNESNVGLFGNFNRCLELAQGEYVRILCNDDRLTEGCLEREVELMERYPNAVLLSSQARRVDENGNRCGVFANHLPAGVYAGDAMIGHILWVLSHYCYNPMNYPSGVLLRRDRTRAADGFDATFELVGDLDYWMKLLTTGDAIIADHIGCEVMVHKQQVGTSVFFEGRYIDEWFALAQKWDDYLQRQGVARRVKEQMSACSLWAATYCLRRKRADAARFYWKTATTKGLSLFSLTRAMTRFVWIQLLLRKRHVRLQPAVSYQPLA